MILILRSLLFNLVFCIAAALQLIIYAPVFFFLPHKHAIKVPKLWARVTMFLQRLCAGTTCRVVGQENLPKGAYLIAAKHQSAWETFSLLPFLDDPALILKRELMWIPVFGSYMWKVRMIPIDRGSPLKALKTIISKAKEYSALGRQILIFPEGTRQQPGAAPDYKVGIATLYSELNLPVVIIAHNAGLYWPRGNFRRYPGQIEVEILPAIAPGLSKKEFLKELISRTETACDKLLIKAAQSDNPPAMPPTAIERLRQYGIEWQGRLRH